ncbi:MAG TPA: hypothetical protein PK413_00220 [Thermoanaerobaculia bacterium]|nr:hypothetical protein [Thermoanaerobaculia bacterium]
MSVTSEESLDELGLDPPAEELEEDEEPRPRVRSARPQPGGADLLQDLLPLDFDWREVVREHPWPSMIVAALGGFLLARSHGEEIVQALSDFASARISEHVNELLGDDVL